VLLTAEDAAGESFYNPWLPDIVAELFAAGIAIDSAGALCVFSTEVIGPDGNPVPLMLRKKDGGYGYDTTDLATIRYRIRDLKADRILYVVDSRKACTFASSSKRPAAPAGSPTTSTPTTPRSEPSWDPTASRSRPAPATRSSS
jgi:arginyl-tRNA synthetase